MRRDSTEAALLEIRYQLLRRRLQSHRIQLRRRLTRQVVSKPISPAIGYWCLDVGSDLDPKLA